MKDQFDVWQFDFPGKGVHPCVLISHPDICARSRVVNVLFCTSQRQSRRPHEFEVMLNSAEGLDWETFCDCSVIYAVDSRELFGMRGHVSFERRRAIRSAIRDMFLLAEVD